jgi:hypothetical protein
VSGQGTGFRSWQERERERRERQEQVRREYRVQQLAGCAHGRVRRIGLSGGTIWTGLECRVDKCGIVYLSAAEIFQQWKDGSAEGRDQAAEDEAPV